MDKNLGRGRRTIESELVGDALPNFLPELLKLDRRSLHLGAIQHRMLLDRIDYLQRDFVRVGRHRRRHRAPIVRRSLARWKKRIGSVIRGKIVETAFRARSWYHGDNCAPGFLSLNLVLVATGRRTRLKLWLRDRVSMDAMAHKFGPFLSRSRLDAYRASLVVAVVSRCCYDAIAGMSIRSKVETKPVWARSLSQLRVIFTSQIRENRLARSPGGGWTNQRHNVSAECRHATAWPSRTSVAIARETSPLDQSWSRTRSEFRFVRSTGFFLKAINFVADEALVCERETREYMIVLTSRIIKFFYNSKNVEYKLR